MERYINVTVKSELINRFYLIYLNNPNDSKLYFKIFKQCLNVYILFSMRTKNMGWPLSWRTQNQLTLLFLPRRVFYLNSHCLGARNVVAYERKFLGIELIKWLLTSCNFYKRNINLKHIFMILGGNGGDVNIGNNQTNYGGSSGPQNVYNVRENNGGNELPMFS